MKGKFLLLIWFAICGSGVVGAVEREGLQLDNLMRVFEQNPANPQTTILLLKELNRQGKTGNEVLTRYFKTQKEVDYLKEYNWTIVRDYVDDIDAPQIRYIFENSDKFILHFSKDDVYQKLDNMLVNYLEKLYVKDRIAYERQLKGIRERGYEHYDVITDYFAIRELRGNGNADDYFYKARKLFRYFPENRRMIKEITAGALEIMTDISRLKVIQLWAGKTVESGTDFDAIYNYALISRKCGYGDVARKYANIANGLALKNNDLVAKRKAGELQKLLN